MNEETKQITTHNHDGINSQKIKMYNIIPTFTMTPTELNNYLSKGAVNGEEFNVFNGTKYYKYIYINNNWKKVELT